MASSKKRPKTPLLGAHFSIAKGLDQAIYTAHGYGCPTLQIFTKNSSSWKEKTLSRTDIDTFREARQETGMGAIASHTSYLINLASIEYFKAVDRKTLKPKVITAVFKEVKDGTAKVIGFSAKKARGMMARHMIKNRIDQPQFPIINFLVPNPTAKFINNI